LRKVIVIEFVTLDGVIQSPGGIEEDPSGNFIYGGWISKYSDPVSNEIIREQMDMPFDLLLGRNTFEIWASYWPQHDKIWPNVNTAVKYVVSNTMHSHDWQPSVFISGDISKEIARIKEQKGPDLHIYGSGNLIQTLIKHDLVDEFWLQIYPITIGIGKRLFAQGTTPAAFKLNESKVTLAGVIFAKYERVGTFPA
jgi:dihydrofolate reductase